MQHSIRVGKWLVAAVLVLAPCLADAAGLGRLTIQSALGEPFRAEIDLVAVPKEERATLSVRLASPADYEKAGLQYNNVVAGLSLRIENRSNGQPVIRITSSRPVNEFVVDVLVDLVWASGRIIREYRALLDPPGAPTAAVAESQPAPVAVQPTPRVLTTEPAQHIEAAPRAEATPGSYGPIKRGETLSQVARNVRPDGVSVEQMLVGLYRSNPDAFIRNNMNLMRSGKILRVPERQEIAAIPQQEAVKEYRAQVADWNSYRRRLADAAAPAPEGGSATRGRISARVEDTTSGETRDVVRLSKGEGPGPAGAAGQGAGTAKERIRTLEEEIVTREKALKEANERIAELEKTIKDMQRLAEIKSAGMAAAQQKAEAAAKSEPGKPEAAQPKPAEPKPVSAAPKPKPPLKPVAAPLPPEPSFVESLLANPLYLAVLGLVVLGGLALWLMRRRRSAGSQAAALFAPTAGTLTPVAAVAGAAAAAAPVGAPSEPAAEPVAEIDPVEEARIYVMHGRDNQAEAILKEGIARNPRREAVYVNLLEIYSARKDKAAFAQYAGELNRLTQGAGENWAKVAAMGYVLDAENPLYAAGRAAAPAAPVEERKPAVDVDLDLTAAGGETPDVALDAGPGEAAAHAPSAAPAPQRAPEPPADVPPLDFHIELPPADGASDKAVETKSDTSSFKLPDIDLNLDEKPHDAAAGKDAHWYDVQTKFDLAKAYEEMGDKAGAQQILNEVIHEGDAEQQTQAKQLLAKLG
ncbi:MAG TPA: FimV/HubP family polar landmark protein [Burkholderiales bacterium]|nr:FimV/HubP family polar landmark protein [Burkholderiales bacterium]